MDLSSLACPSLFCECNGCYSTLGILQNEWIKLSNQYACSPSWQSINLKRFTISQERETSPEDSELEFLAGRATRIIWCKTCEQRLGVLCALNRGPTIFWKLSQVLFRGTWTYQKVDPSFTDVSHQTPSKSISQVEAHNSSTQPHTQNPATHIGHIASSVIAGVKDEAIAAMRDAFTSLRMEEMNGSERISLAERLRRENDTLKQEIEMLKSGGRNGGQQTAPFSAIDAPLQNLHYSDSLRGSRKRPYMDGFPNGRTRSSVGCSQDEEDDDITGSPSVGDRHAQTKHVPLNDFHEHLHDENYTANHSSPRTSNLHVQVNQPPHQSTSKYTDTNGYDTLIKRRRVSNISAPGPLRKRPRGRPRKSDPTHTPRSNLSSEYTVNMSGSSQQKDQNSTPNTTPSDQPTKRKRGRPVGTFKSVLGLRKSEQRAATNNNIRDSGDVEQRTSIEGTESPKVRDGSEKENPDRASKRRHRNTGDEDAAEKQKRLIAMRDRMAEEAMRHEEELAGEAGYYG